MTPTDPTPLLLVDVDGVLAPFGLGASDEERADEDRAGERPLDLDGLGIRVVGDVRGKVARLEDVFECVWATAWEDMAPEVFGRACRFGARWPVIAFDGSDPAGPTWKLVHVAAWCERHAAGRRVAWVDDDLSRDAEAWAEERGETLLLRTDHTRGLTAVDVERLVTWAESSRVST